MSTKKTPRASTNFPSTGGDVDDDEGEMAVFEQSLQEGEFRAIEANLPRTMSAKITIAGRAKVVQKGMQVYIRLQDLLIRNNRKLEEFYVFMTNSEPATIVSVFGMPLVDLTIGGGSLACVRENVRGPIDVPLTSLTKYPEELPVRAWGYRYVILALPDQPIRDMPAKVVGYAELEVSTWQSGCNKVQPTTTPHNFRNVKSRRVNYPPKRPKLKQVHWLILVPTTRDLLSRRTLVPLIPTMKCSTSLRVCMKWLAKPILTR